MNSSRVDLARALRWLKENTAGLRSRIYTVLHAFLSRPDETDLPYLKRMKLDAPRDFPARLDAKLVSLGLRATAGGRRQATSQTTAKGP